MGYSLKTVYASDNTVQWNYSITIGTWLYLRFLYGDRKVYRRFTSSAYFTAAARVKCVQLPINLQSNSKSSLMEEPLTGTWLYLDWYSTLKMLFISSRLVIQLSTNYSIVKNLQTLSRSMIAHLCQRLDKTFLNYCFYIRHVLELILSE